jgi:hypothetical protein
VQQGQVGRRVEVRPQQATGSGGVHGGLQVLLRLDQVAGPERGRPGVPQNYQRYDVPRGEAEGGERGRVLGDPATGGSHFEEIAPGASVSHLDQVQDDAEPFRARAREVVRARRGRGGQLPDLGWRAVVDARCRESGRELGMAEQDLPGHRCQEQVDLPGIAPDREREDMHAQELRGEWPQRAA